MKTGEKKFKKILAQQDTRISDFEFEIETLIRTIEDIQEEVDIKNRELHMANIAYEELDSRYEVLMDACRKLMQEKESNED